MLYRSTILAGLLSLATTSASTFTAATYNNNNLHSTLHLLHDSMDMSQQLPSTDPLTTPLRVVTNLNYNYPPALIDNANQEPIFIDMAYNGADIIITTYVDSSETMSRPYTYQLEGINLHDYSIHIVNKDMGSHDMPSGSTAHVERMRMYKSTDTAPVCATNDFNTCMTSSHKLTVNCVDTDQYPLRLTVNDNNSGQFITQNYILNCKLHEFGSRGDLGHLGPGK